MDRRTALLGLTWALITSKPHGLEAAPSHAVTIDRTDGTGSGKRPAVLLLHGADGVTRLAQYQFASAAFAAQGYTVLFPHYFDLTGDLRASYDEIGSRYPIWLEALERALTDVVDDPTINADRIAVVGVSLGGALALSLAGRHGKIRAVISYFAFKPSDVESTGPRTPTLILHGDADRVVPVKNADLIEAALRARGVIVEKQIYPGEGHGFSQRAQLDAATRSTAFLNRHLG